ncbi:MAG TPA: hypothetical protein DCL15_18755 [Chloroflexi bacterium]|nr:hypothetical protein [Chloroflexota bacterium]HHW88559.1 hypothetical protein [Chloroflexota bacterium]
MKHRWVTLFVLGALLLIGAWTTFFMSPAFAGDNRWDPIGLYGGYVTDVAVDPRNANIVYAGVYSTGLYKSSDGGASWSHIFPMSGGYATVAVAPTNSSVLYLNVWMSDRQGLYRSSNGGQDWQPITWGENQGSFCGQAVAVSPIDANLLLVASERGMDNYCLRGADGGNGIYRSADGGATWQLVGSPAWSGGIRAIQFAPSAPYIVYAAGGNGILRSTDGGQSWTRVDTAFVTPPLVYSLAVDPHNAQIVYIGTHESGIYKTTNGGASWLPIGAGLGSPSVLSILIHTSNQQVLYAGTMEGGVYRSLDSDGLSWTSMSGIGSRSVYALAGDAQPNPNLYAGTYSGIWLDMNLDLYRQSVAKFVPATGGSVTTDVGISLTVPASALSTGVTMVIADSATPSQPFIDARAPVRVVTLRALDQTGAEVETFNQPLTLVIEYTDAELAERSLSEDTLNVAWWDGAAWVNLLPCAGCGVDKANNRVTVRIDHFSEFSLTGSAQIFLPTVTRN